MGLNDIVLYKLRYCLYSNHLNLIMLHTKRLPRNLNTTTANKGANVKLLRAVSKIILNFWLSTEPNCLAGSTWFNSIYIWKYFIFQATSDARKGPTDDGAKLRNGKRVLSVFQVEDVLRQILQLARVRLLVGHRRQWPYRQHLWSRI